MTDNKPQILRRGWRFLARLDLGAILLLIVLLLAALGSCFPQLAPQVAADPERLARWEEAMHARYGGLAGTLAAVGLFRWFRSPLFLAPLALLVLTTLACILERWGRVWRRAFDRPVVCPDAVFDSAPCTATIPPAPAKEGVALVRECLEQHGLRVITNQQTNQLTNRPTIHLRGDRHPLSPLATLVAHLAVLLLVLGALLSGWLGWRETLTLAPGATVEVGHGSGLTLRNEGFAIERYPDGSAAGYEATVAVLAGGQEVGRGVARVNAPLTYRGVRMYLQAYEESMIGASVTMLAVHDPGYGLVMTAGFLLLLGLTVSFYFPHAWVHARIEPDGALRLAGRAEQRAWDFEREFGVLVEEIRHTVGSTS
jgi:cytochrome c biogenesis protein